MVIHNDDNSCTVASFRGGDNSATLLQSASGNYDRRHCHMRGHCHWFSSIYCLVVGRRASRSRIENVILTSDRCSRWLHPHGYPYTTTVVTLWIHHLSVQICRISCNHQYIVPEKSQRKAFWENYHDDVCYVSLSFIGCTQQTNKYLIMILHFLSW